MKRWKRAAVLLLAGCMLTALAGCQSEERSADTDGEVPAGRQEEKLNYTNKQPLELWENPEDMPYYDPSVSGQAVTLTPYIADNAVNKGCVIICPGGGYSQVVAEKEGTEPAEAFNESGISAFVLQYRVAPYHYEAILSDVCRAVRYVRYHAEAFGIDPDRIAVMGFSAGGHLAAMSLEHAVEDVQARDAVDKVSALPDCGILCYPVMTMEDPYAHQRSRENFLGEQSGNEELRRRYSAELAVDKTTPPCFIWHCQGDTNVPYQNSQMFADAMKEAGVECEFHLYQRGSHGLGMAGGVIEVEGWFPACTAWLQSRGY